MRASEWKLARDAATGACDRRDADRGANRDGTRSRYEQDGPPSDRRRQVCNVDLAPTHVQSFGQAWSASDRRPADSSRSSGSLSYACA